MSEAGQLLVGSRGVAGGGSLLPEGQNAWTVDYNAAARRYAPRITRVLFVAESPPVSVDHYFYFDHVRSQDALWVGLMKGLYADLVDTMCERPRKAQWLARFRDDGFRLIDVLKNPLPSNRLTSSQRVAMIRGRLPDTIQEVREIDPHKKVLIKATVYDALIEPFRCAGLPVVDVRLPFPGSGQQSEFARKFIEVEKDLSD